MSEYLIQGDTLTAIADAIRGKTGDTATMTAADMAGLIDGISTGDSSIVTTTYTSTANTKTIAVPWPTDMLPTYTLVFDNDDFDNFTGLVGSIEHLYIGVWTFDPYYNVGIMGGLSSTYTSSISTRSVSMMTKTNSSSTGITYSLSNGMLNLQSRVYFMKRTYKLIGIYT